MQIKLFWRIPGHVETSLCANNTYAREILLYERRTLKIILEMITGHCRLRKHLHTIGIASEPDCRKCGIEEETAHHIVCECKKIHQGKIVRETTSPT